MQPGLDALIHPRSLVATEPLVIHGLSDAIAALVDLPFLGSLDALLSSWPATVRVHLPDVRDEASSIAATPHDARKLFANGMGLLFDDAHEVSPVLTRWLDAIRADLGLSGLTVGRCLVYATPAGGGTAPHFDQNANFVLHLHGMKRWWLAPNHHVERPLTRHTMGLPPDAELATYAAPELPTEMPADRTEIVLAPGSLLYVPRGFWHATEAMTDAMQLNFTYSAPTWIDLLTTALRSQLARSAAWRATALPDSPDQLDALLRDLDVPSWTAAAILGITEP